jgi:uncharacterized caspase-like protein
MTLGAALVPASPGAVIDRAMPRRAVVGLGLAGLLAGCGLPRGRGAAARVALVIGNAAYEHAPALGNAAHDGADMCDRLRRLGFRTLCHTNLRDREAFDAKVREYAALLGPQTAGLVFYSGHGVQAGTANYLIPTAARPRVAAEAPARVLYPLDELFQRLRERPARFQLVILDACRTDLPGAASGLAAVTDAPPDTLVLYATAAKGAAFAGDGRNGPLTKHVLAHIGTRGQTLAQFLRNVTTAVDADTIQNYGRRQTPHVYGPLSSGFCFAGCPGEFDPPPIY